MGFIDNGAFIGNNVKIGNNVTIKKGCIIEDNVVINDNVYLDYEVIVHPNVTIGSNSYVGTRSIIGEYNQDFFVEMGEYINPPLVIGENALIRSMTIIYSDSVIGDSFQTGHRVTIREKSVIGSHVRVGTLTDIQGDCEIEDYVNIHSNVHIGKMSRIKKYAWLFPYVVLTNDPNPPSNSLMGVTIEEYAVVATGTIVLPGKNVGSDALVGAGSVVTKDVPNGSIAVGCPAHNKGSVEMLKDAVTGGQVYPWRYSFDRGMPWEGIGYSNWENNKNADKE